MKSLTKIIKKISKDHVFLKYQKTQTNYANKQHIVALKFAKFMTLIK